MKNKNNNKARSKIILMLSHVDVLLYFSPQYNF